MKTAFLFPGQGAQVPGMGKDFYEHIDSCRELIDLASETVSLNLPEICFTENEKLDQTEYTQVAMVAVEAAILRALQEEGIEPVINAGLSLGEYSALIASGALTAKDAFRLVRKRGILMQEAVPEGGAMAAVLGMAAEQVEIICRQTKGIVEVANYNCPGQIVITGEHKAVGTASEQLKAAGAKRILPLNVSGPFHSSLLQAAGAKLGEALNETTISEIQTPYVSNVTAQYVKDKCLVRELLERQVYSSVRWQQSMEEIMKDRPDIFIEIGPGKTLSGFMKKIDRTAKVFRVSTLADLKTTVAAIKGE